MCGGSAKFLTNNQQETLGATTTTTPTTTTINRATMPTTTTTTGQSFTQVLDFPVAKVVSLNLQHLVLNILLDVLIGQVPATGAAALHVYNAAYKGQLN